MRDRTLAGLAAACLAVPLLASCGIPGSSAPEPIEPAPTDFDQSSPVEPEEFLPTNDASTTVQNFLRASSGEPNGRDERLNQFTGGDREFSETADGIGLLDGVDYTLGDGTNVDLQTVTVTGSVVGTYLPDGSVLMNNAPREYEEQFVLERDGLQDNWTISELPRQAMMLRSQFQSAYAQAPLYFQATGAAGETDLLVPDLRWIYDNLDENTANGIRLGWLLQGNFDWVRPAARSAIPSGTTGQSSREDDVVAIDLTLGEQPTELDAETVDAIAAQIAWSLGLTGEFSLRINREEVATGSLADWRDWNAIAPVTDENDEVGYFISEDTVWQFANDRVTDDSSDHPWVGFSTPGLEQVAVAADHRIAAVVDTGDGDVLQIGAGDRNMTTVEGVTGDLRDPQWLTERTVVLIDDGVLTAVDTDSEAAQVLAGEEVEALSAAADGRRLAYVEGGRAWAVPLSHDADGNFQIGDFRRLGLGITAVTDVAWSSEDWVWVAGERTGGTGEKLFRVALDNAEIEDQAGTSPYPLAEQIAANTADPVEPDQDSGEPNIVVISSVLYRVYSTTIEPVEDADGQLVQGSAPFTFPG
ncbi:hypothetical protein L0U85_10265 [Glycomyces sp. L485]|uniref:LpqB family beta-propeller domain-containing protein n=1 Tax=Glycomyces sp. L485 TaxID=2909235 RepID=UPI001F4A7889|nr:LpqB family beta-propeller domain-containing protein [Glycomyces sp. L485]MCH7231232.1 hypothetical protein [Glycomyces sp. L485]